MRQRLLVLLLIFSLLVLCACVKHTYYVELTNGKSFYVDSPLLLDTESGTYTMRISGSRWTVPMDDVSFIDDAAQICFKNAYTDTYTCVDGLYQF
jgi:hypothetical protein